jgi:signal transduction histidine kinase/ActR/RegA family two-component response regulator
MQQGHTVVNNDSKTDPRTSSDYDRIYEANGERAYVAVPLMRDGRWVASLWVSDDRPRQWTKEELSLLQTAAERTWTAIEKLRAEAERERLLTSVQEARDAAEKANQLKDEFLATLSHELRNPLNVILGYSELLLRMREIEQSPRLAQMGEALRRNAQSQSQLINDLLDLSRLQRGKISLNQETVSLPAIIDNAVETVRADAAGKGVEIRVNVGDQLLLVEGDRLRLQQIAWNLLNNAVKFTPAGGSIEIALSNEDEKAVFAVTDTGQGIDANFLPHVFEMFRQADGSNRRRHGGLGIGLALVHQLVQLHGGKISAQSDGPNKGARFTVRLPLLRETASLKSPVAASSGPVELNVFAQTNFLIVDDSEDTIAMLEELLRVVGANVMTATNGADALRIAAENEFDVILSDISMPEMDGFEFLQRLRKIDGRQNVPVIAITGFGRSADIARARAAGFYSHLTKPLNLQVLTEVLKQLEKEKAELSGTATDVDYDISAGPVF